MLSPRLLLVDDEADFVGLLAKRLRRRKLEVSVAHTAEDALAILADQEVDLVVLDIRLPGMDGLQTLAEIKRTYPQVHVIMMTGFADTEMAARAMSHGAVAYLVKPVDVRELLDQIYAAVEQQPPQSPPPSSPS